MALDICGGDGVYLPPNNCDDCEQFSERLAAIERLLEGMGIVTHTHENTDGTTVIAHYIGRVEEGE